MNKIYKLKRCAATGMLVPVAENRSARGKQKGRAIVGVVGGAVALAGALQQAGAQTAVIEVHSGNTQVYQSPNGVQVIDIATTGAAGVSHNRFNQYNVDPRGLILNNNSPLTQAGPLQSQLAGQVVPNVNLAGEARVILNEVMAANRSTLAGFTEVVGGTADVIVANPWGITCTGCGFINTDRVTLTTGTPQIGAGGAVQGFAVNSGDVLVQGQGLAAQSVSILDIVARSVRVDGQINAQDLQVVAGTNTYNYATRTADAGPASVGATPSYAIDSSVLGGMYANRIRIIANEAGVGVRMDGAAAATADDFVLTADGRIEIRGQISAQRDLVVQQTGAAASGAAGLVLDGAELSARQDLTLDSDQAAISMTNGRIAADRDLTVTATALSDSGGSGSTRFAGQDVEVTVNNAATMSGTTWGAGDAVAITANSVAVGAGGATIYSGAEESSSDRSITITARTQSVNLGAAQVTASTDLRVSATQGAVNIGAGGKLEAADDIEVSAASLIEQSGEVLGGGAVRIRATDAAVTLINEGRIEATTHLLLGVAGQTVTIDNRTAAAMVAGESVTIHSTAIGNAGTIQSAGSLELNHTSLTNQANARLLAGTDATISGGFIVNDTAALIQSGANLQITGGNVTNQSQAQIAAGAALTLNGGNLTNEGRISSVGSLSIAVGDLLNGSNNNAQAVILGGAGGLTPSTITVQGSLDNFGAIHGGQNLSLTSQGITNRSTGGLSAIGQLGLVASGSGSIDNSGALYAGQSLSLTAIGDSIVNRAGSGTIDSGGSITTQSAHFTNNGAIVGFGNISINATSSFLNQTALPGVSKTLGDVFNVRNGNNWKIANEGSFDKGMNAWVEEDEFSRREQLVGITPEQLSALPKAQILSIGSNGVLSIQYGQTGTNSVAILSAPTIQISGSGTFTNQDLSLLQYELRRRWIRVEDEKSGDNTYGAWARIDPNRQGWDGNVDDDDFNWGNWNPGAGWSSVGSYEGEGGFAGWLADDARAAAVPGAIRLDASVVQRFGAGIFASSFSFSGGTLNNISSTAPDNPSLARVGGAQSGSVSAIDGPASSDLSLTGSVSLSGVSVSLPTNPNGFFVVVPNPNARFLVETNPLFAVGSNFVGSDFLARRYGFNPDDVQRRLGDPNYEAFLIRQQLIEQTGSNLLRNFGSEAAQMQGLMEQAVDQAQGLGLVWGRPLSPSQIAGLTSDIVWMEEVVVNGQTVLAPRVYLAPQTVASVIGGAVIAADQINIAGDALNNTGGTIEGRDTLTVTTTGDITNTSGTIRGGDLNLTSTEGSIINQTVAEGQGDEFSFATTIGQTGTIEATGRLDLSAAQDISVIGANVSAGGEASLNAGGNITFDTIVDRNTNTTGTEGAGVLGVIDNSWSTTTTTTETNIGSGLQVGGNLSIRSGGDTTFAGSQVSVGGDLEVDTGGDFNVIARQDTVTTTSQERTSGVGVGGGVYGSQVTTTDSFRGTNVGSTLTVGGNADIQSSGAVTLQGSTVEIGGDARIDAVTGISILDGLDEERTTTRTETTTILSIDSGGSSGAGTQRQTEASSAPLRAQASASGGAGAQASGDSSVNFYQTTVEVTRSGSTTSVGSSLVVGGNLNATTQGTLTIQGSNVESVGNMDLSAQEIQVLTGRNTSWSETEVTRTSIGIFSEGEAQAGAAGEANARAGSMGTNADASGGAGASTSGVTTIGARVEQEQSSTFRQTNTSSTIRSGGNMNLQAQGTAEFVGADVESGGDMSISAENIITRAAEDIEISSSSRTTQTMGLYIGADASAQASGQAQAGQLAIGNDNQLAQGEASAEANASAGLRYNRATESQTEGSVTNVTSTFRSGGNFTRTATDTIEDQGTQVEAGGNIDQSARVIRSLAAEDRTFSSSSSSSNDARIGVGASASAEAGANTGGRAEADAGAGAGIRASYSGSFAQESESSTTAVTSSFRAGGSINSRSEEQTTLVGTQFEAGQDINLEAGSLDFQAARDTSSSASSSNDVSANLAIDVKGTAPGGSLEAEWEMVNERENTSTVRTGSMQAGGNLTIRTREDASFEGTQLQAGGGASIDAGGDVNFSAARDTVESESIGAGAGLSVGIEKAGGVEVGVEGNFSRETVDSSTARTAGIQAGAGGVTIRSGGDANFEGTRIETQGDASIQAEGDVNMRAARDTERRTAVGVEASLEVSREGDSGGGAFSGAASASFEDRVQSTGTAISSGGSVSIQGRNVLDQEAQIESQEGTSVDGNVIRQRAENRDIGIGIQAGANSRVDPPEDSSDSSQGNTPSTNTSTNTGRSGRSSAASGNR